MTTKTRLQPAPPVRKPAWRLFSLAIGLASLALLLVVAVPLFVCMPPNTDALQFDLCARTLLQGGVQYRDIFEHGLPGITLLHAVIRSMVGWRSEALAIVDLAIVGAEIL